VLSTACRARRCDVRVAFYSVQGAFGSEMYFLMKGVVEASVVQLSALDMELLVGPNRKGHMRNQSATSVSVARASVSTQRGGDHGDNDASGIGEQSLVVGLYSDGSHFGQVRSVGRLQCTASRLPCSCSHSHECLRLFRTQISLVLSEPRESTARALEKCELFALAKVRRCVLHCAPTLLVLGCHLRRSRWIVSFVDVQTALDELLPLFPDTAERMRVEAEQTSRRMFWARYSLTLALRRRQQEIDAGLSSPADRAMQALPEEDDGQSSVHSVRDETSLFDGDGDEGVAQSAPRASAAAAAAAVPAATLNGGTSGGGESKRPRSAAMPSVRGRDGHAPLAPLQTHTRAAPSTGHAGFAATPATASASASASALSWSSVASAMAAAGDVTVAAGGHSSSMPSATADPLVPPRSAAAPHALALALSAGAMGMSRPASFSLGSSATTPVSLKQRVEMFTSSTVEPVTVKKASTMVRGLRRLATALSSDGEAKVSNGPLSPPRGGSLSAAATPLGSTAGPVITTSGGAATAPSTTSFASGGQSADATPDASAHTSPVLTATAGPAAPGDAFPGDNNFDAANGNLVSPTHAAMEAPHILVDGRMERLHHLPEQLIQRLSHTSSNLGEHRRRNGSVRSLRTPLSKASSEGTEAVGGGGDAAAVASPGGVSVEQGADAAGAATSHPSFGADSAEAQQRMGVVRVAVTLLARLARLRRRRGADAKASAVVSPSWDDDELLPRRGEDNDDHAYFVRTVYSAAVVLCSAAALC
jgi:hypothetical protein